MRTRAVTESDEEALADLFGRAEEAEIGRRGTTRADVRDLLSAPGLDLTSRTRVVESGDTRLHGFAALHPAPQAGQLRAHLVVAPPGDVAGTARTLLDLLDGWAERDAPGAGVPVTMFQLPHCLAHDALAAAGWAVVHSYTRLTADLTLDLTLDPGPVEVAAGVRLRAAADDHDRRAVHAVLEDALAGHWNHERRGFPDFERDQRRRDGHDPALWWLAEVGGAPAGALIARDPAGRAWIAWLGVLGAFRGRGIGTALLRTVFGLLRERGHDRVGVDVDTHNATGAVNVYKAAGMTELGTADQWRRTYP